MNRRTLGWIVLLLLAGSLLACASATRNESLRVRLYNYAAAIRWNEIEQAVAYVDPAVLVEKPFGEEQRQRWSQVQVSRYFEGPRGSDAEGRITQTVQIELIDRATQSVRTIVDRQRWRYDETAKTWWLESGLPEL
ncbi:MAG: hypothetical protein DYH17_12540 [Xanthomonadales bacterium PRO6]|nr:hypothetical protein [Xanthomonadales bacterium]MCE7932190.1 hypothetical protein [Xanthomonadales bacterium PRO6]